MVVNGGEDGKMETGLCAANKRFLRTRPARQPAIQCAMAASGRVLRAGENKRCKARRSVAGPYLKTSSRAQKTLSERVSLGDRR